MFGSLALSVANHRVNNPSNENPYNNGGVTIMDHGFMGPGNQVVDKKTNLSNFKQLPDKCTDWAALEHDVDYHNLGINGRPSISDVSKIDNKAIDKMITECSKNQPWATKIMVGGLQMKQHIEELAEAAVYPFGSNSAVYPRANANGSEIDWFTKSKSRRRPILSEYETFRATATIASQLAIFK